MKPSDIRCLWRNTDPTEFWNEMMDDEIRNFLQESLEKIPERTLVRLKQNDSVNVLNTKMGVFQKCIVEEVDGFMAKLVFPDNRRQWFYRGDRYVHFFSQIFGLCNRTIANHWMLIGCFLRNTSFP